jgi:hypothetical protein
MSTQRATRVPTSTTVRCSSRRPEVSRPTSRRSLTNRVRCDEVSIDALVIKFEDTFVTAGDALKGKALLLFRRIFTDRRRPADGDVLGREGQMPQSYAAERAPTAFERELWARFWELANDPRRPASVGSEPSTARPSRHGSGRIASMPSRCVRRVS